MATIETVYHDFLSLSPEDQERLLAMLPEFEPIDDERWAELKPELDRRLAESDAPGAVNISAEESIRRMRERILGHQS